MAVRSFSDKRGKTLFESDIRRLAHTNLLNYSKKSLIRIIVTNVAVLDLLAYARDEDGNWYDMDELLSNLTNDG